MSSREADKDAPVFIRRTGQTELIAVGGGKGGVGKSMLSANLGLCLAEAGHRVILIDADLGGANLHSCLGIDPPKLTLSDFMDKRVASIDALVTKTPYPNLSLISGALDEVTVANPRYSQKVRLMKEITRLDASVVILDLGAGTSYNTLDFFLIADHGIVSILPEPTSIENAYRFVKAAYFRRLKNLEHLHGMSKTVDRLMADKEQLKIRTPADLLVHLVREAPERGRLLAEDLAAFSFELVVNQVRGQDDIATATNVRTACAKYFGINIRLLGAVPYDNVVWQAVRKRQAVSRAFPQADVSRAVRALAQTLAPRVRHLGRPEPQVPRLGVPLIGEARP
jgi:flagellar biosynthesis protein FlhG